MPRNSERQLILKEVEKVLGLRVKANERRVRLGIHDIEEDARDESLYNLFITLQSSRYLNARNPVYRGALYEWESNEYFTYFTYFILKDIFKQICQRGISCTILESEKVHSDLSSLS